MSLDQKTAIVTGAGSGIGRAVSVALLKDGYSVVLAGRRVGAMAETLKHPGVDPDHALAVPTNVGDPDEVHSLFQKTQNRFGRVDLLFNNAGINVSPASIDELEVEHWLAVVNVNLTGAFLCTREAFRVMKSQDPIGGRIINNGSVSAITPRPKSTPYTATKHGITGLTKSTSLDGRPFNIACGQIDIGNADTEMVRRSRVNALQANGQKLVEPTMDVDNVARAVLYMANLPLDANVLFMTVMASKMPFVGRG